MWIILNQQVQPDAAYWHGRRWLATLDAVAWPALIAAPFSQALQAHSHTGLVGQVVVALAVVVALTRLRRALWANHRYRFTTWRWGRVVVLLLALGALLKVGAS
jgi:hypothetical protein